MLTNTTHLNNQDVIIWTEYDQVIVLRKKVKQLTSYNSVEDCLNSLTATERKIVGQHMLRELYRLRSALYSYNKLHSPASIVCISELNKKIIQLKEISSQ